MQISERQVGDVTVLDLSGKLTLTDSAGRLKDKVNSLIFQGNKKVILNLGELSYMDSSGLGEIVACHTTVSRGGGDQAGQPRRAHQGPAGDDQAADRLRLLRHRAGSGQRDGAVG